MLQEKGGTRGAGCCWRGEGLARKLRQGDLDKNFSGVRRTKDGCEWVKGK